MSVTIVDCLWCKHEHTGLAVKLDTSGRPFVRCPASYERVGITMAAWKLSLLAGTEKPAG